MGRRLRARDFKTFQISKPWGYYPPDVDKTIREYESTISKLNAGIVAERQKSDGLKSRLKRAQDELKDMHLQMSSIEISDSDDAVQDDVLRSFKEYPRDMEEPVRSASSKPSKGYEIEEPGESDEDPGFKIVG
jgi:uncharacterized coiled-coil protein SlyX